MKGTIATILMLTFLCILQAPDATADVVRKLREAVWPTDCAAP